MEKNMSEIAKRPQFKVAGVATIKHLNVRKEGPPDLFTEEGESNAKA
jgi:hypothetical protein